MSNLHDGEDISRKGNDEESVLLQFSTNLTQMAADGKLDPVIGRNTEIERVAQILSRRKKNNPVIIGEPGCVFSDTIITVRKVSDETKHETIEI